MVNHSQHERPLCHCACILYHPANLLANDFDPVKFNQSIVGDIHPDEIGHSAGMRMMIGAGFGGIGLMGLILGYMLEQGEATTALLYAMAAAYALLLASLLLVKQKGHMDHLPKPPLVLFPTMFLLCIVGAVF